MKILSSKRHGSALRAWEFSRPLEKNADESMVKKLDLPVNEFERFDLEVESTIAMREIFTSMRDHVIWAQTSRVNNPLEFGYQNQFSHLFMEGQREKMKKMKQEMRQDDYRLELPVFSNCKYNLSISARGLIRVSKYLDYLIERIGNSSVKISFIRSSLEVRVLLEKFGYGSKAIENYKMKRLLKPIVAPVSGVVGDHAVVLGWLPFSLRAQLVRHRELGIADNLEERLCGYEADRLTLNSAIKMQASGSFEDWRGVISKRSCWIAHYSLWSDYLNEAKRVCGFSESALLPCSGGVCPFDKDARLRLEGKDPNPPCPIHANLNNVAMSLVMVERSHSMIGDDVRDHKFWDTELDKNLFDHKEKL